MTLIIPRLYVGSVEEASSKEWLKRHRITHIVNCACELPNFHLEEYSYLKLTLLDRDDNIKRLFPVTTEYISLVLRDNVKNNVLVHCHLGCSRSVSVVCHYLMKTQNFSYDKALSFIREKRPIARPNMFYEIQLQELERS
jgi:protein-tyrosine phosphatase